MCPSGYLKLQQAFHCPSCPPGYKAEDINAWRCSLVPQAYPIFSVLRFALTDAEERCGDCVLLSMQTEEQKERGRSVNEAIGMDLQSRYSMHLCMVEVALLLWQQCSTLLLPWHAV